MLLESKPYIILRNFGGRSTSILFFNKHSNLKLILAIYVPRRNPRSKIPIVIMNTWNRLKYTGERERERERWQERREAVAGLLETHAAETRSLHFHGAFKIVFLSILKLLENTKKTLSI